MYAYCLKTLLSLVFGYSLCVVFPVNGDLNESYLRDSALDYDLAVVQAIWRHGNRTQTTSYPLSSKEATALVAPYGFGNLTPHGRREAIKMGHFLRDRYGDFLPPYFKYYSTVMECTQSRRTQETNLVGMNGIWPPEGPQVWQDQGLGTLWTPIPCKYVPYIEDKVFLPFLSCPKLVELLNTNINMPLFRAELAEATYFGLVNAYVAFHANLTTVSDPQLTLIYDLLESLENNGYSLPKWTQLVYPEPLRTIYRMYLSTFASTRETATLMTGEFWKKTMDIAKSLESGDRAPNDTVFYGYSVHDVQVASIISSLRPKNIVQPVPPYCSILMIEWYRYKWNSTQIAAKFVYRNDTLGNTVTLIIPGCDEICPLDKVKAAVMNLIPDQPRYEYCQTTSSSDISDFEQLREITKLWLPPESDNLCQAFLSDYTGQHQMHSR